MEVGYSYLIPVTSPATRAGDSTMGRETQVGGVISTDLRSNFEDETGNPFTVERARDLSARASKVSSGSGAPVN